MAGPITYVCARYPSVSHTFVLREIQALRRLGVEANPVSVRRVEADQLLGRRTIDEAQRTFALLPASAPRLVGALFELLRREGAGALGRAAARAWALRRPGVRGTLWQLFYLAEAVLLWQRCSRTGSRHIHAHFANVASDVALLACVLGGPQWRWSFTMHGPGDLWDVSALRLADKTADARFVACISDFARSQLMALTDPDVWGRLHVVRCGIEDDHLAGGGDPAEPPLLLNVGRLASAKGQMLLLDLASDLQAGGVPFQLAIIGDGPLKDRLADGVRARGLSDHVTLTGALSQEEVAAHHRRAAIFVLPSFAEGVPVVAMEAMAAGVPVVATRVAGLSELIEDGRSGRLLPPGRTDLLIAAVRELLEDPAGRRALGEAAREAVAAGFHVDREAAKLARLFAGSAP